MTNPCKQCIVQAMCRDACDNFVGFMTEEVLSNANVSFQARIDFCQNIKSGHIVAFKNKKDQWRWRAA